MTNEGSKEFYNVKTSFGTNHANSKRFITSPDGSKPLPVMSQDDVAVVECLKPGESISGVVKRIIPIKGDKWLDYKELVGSEYRILSGENLGVRVVVSVVASHVAVPSLVYQIPTQENSEADPVNVSTGAYTENITALTVQGVNPVSADISYDSNAAAGLGEFGYGRTHNYETRLMDMKDGTVRYYVSSTGYYTFLADHYDSEKLYKEEDGYFVLDTSQLPVEETFKCLNENNAGYELFRRADRTFMLTDKAGSKTYFDGNGNVTGMENSEGKSITIERKSDRFTVTDKTTGRQLTYNLDKDTRLVTSVTDGKREAFFYYNEDKCLKQFVNAAGESTYYTYDRLNRITTVTNDDNITYVTNAYETSDDRDTKTAADADDPSSAMGAVCKNGRVKYQKDALDNTTKFSYKEDETNGNLITTVTTRNGAKKETVTDPYGNVISQTNEAGNTITTTYDDKGNETSVNQPDMTTADGRKTSYSIVYRYDDDGNMTSMSNSMLESGENEVVMTYDDEGNMLTMKNRNGESMECSYYENGQIRTVKDQNGNEKIFEYNSDGQILSETDGNGRSIVYEYKKGDLVSVTDRNGNVTEYTYNSTGLVEKTSVKDRVSGEVYVTTSFYDELNRISMVHDTEGGTTFYEYDCNGNIIEKTEPSGSRTVYKYDGNNQMIRETVYPDEEAKQPDSDTGYTYTKEGLLKTVTDAKSNTVITNSYDKTGNKTKEVETKGEKKLSEKHYEYDELGNMISKTLLCLDDSGNEKESYTTKYIYYPNSRLSKVIDHTGAEITYSYDKSWRTQTVESTTEPKITYDYDANGNVLEVKEDPKGLLNMSKSILRTYDNLNRITSYTDYKGREVKYGYDELGNMTELTYPGGEIVRYAYNPDGTVASMSSKSGGTFYYTYDSYGRLAHIKRPDGSEEERLYDNAGQLIEQVDKDKAGSILQKNSYEYDVFGEITQKNTGTDGDLTKLASISMEYDSANRLIKYNGEEVIYDVKGNMTYGPVGVQMTELSYDARNRLVKAGKVSYTYDCENIRIATTEDGITTEYVTDTGGSLSRMLIAYEDVGTAGESETHYYYGAEGLACQLSVESGDDNSSDTDNISNYFLYHYDNIGSTTLITDKTGKTVETFAYGTYGELLTDVVHNIRFLYNGSYGVVTDSNGLYYMRARYYNPDIKRFINQDIKVGDISNGQGLNRYAYCEGNPVSMVDPFGLCGENANEQGEASKYQWLHNALDVAGLVFDGADVLNAGVYALEGKWGQAAVSLACALPAIGTFVAGVSKATKLAKVGNIIGQTMKYAGKAYMTVQTATQALELAGDGKIQYAVNGGKVTWDIVKKTAGAMALGALSVLSAGSLMKDVTSLTKMSDVRMETTVKNTADVTSGKTVAGEGIGCFVAGTKIKTENGDKNIEDIEEGDYVLSENPETGECGYKRVVKTYIHEKDVLVHVSVGDEEIITTTEHPFYVEGIGFVSAGMLKEGYNLRLSDGTIKPVITIEFEYLDETVYVYNFEVEDFHTYFVSTTGVLVHNSCASKTPLSTDAVKSSSADFYVGPKGAATSLDEYDKFVEGGSGTKPDYYVTPDGVAFKNGIPDNYVENPYRNGSYGVFDENGKFSEKLRIDPATPTGKKGPSYSHYHIDGGKEHYSPRPGDDNPLGF